jgi:hypothetical protein
MYLARFSNDVAPANRERALKSMRRSSMPHARRGWMPVIPLTRAHGGPALQFEVALTGLDQLEEFRHRGAGSKDKTNDWMHAFSEILLAPPAVEILRTEEHPRPVPIQRCAWRVLSAAGPRSWLGLASAGTPEHPPARPGDHRAQRRHHARSLRSQRRLHRPSYPCDDDAISPIPSSPLCTAAPRSPKPSWPCHLDGCAPPAGDCAIDSIQCGCG